DGSIEYMEIHTVEGNVSNKVREKVYKMYPSSSGYVYDNTYIAAFGIPAYETNEAPDVYSYYDIGEYGKTTLKYGSTGSAVIKLQLALRILSYVYPSIDAPDVTGTFDTATKTAVLQYQTLKKLSVDGKCGPQSWASLRSTLIFETSRIASDFLVDESGTLLFYKGNAASDTLPESCQKIAPFAFYENDSLSTLTIHKTLKSVDKNAFAGVKVLQEVICLGKNTEFSELDVESTGNDAFLDAEKIYKYTTYYTVTFDVNGQKTTLQCAENTLPVFEGSTEISDEEYRYFFIGWDRPIAPATEDTSYTATYHKISAKPLLLTGSATDHAFTNGKLSFDVYLMGTPGVSAFSFAADYSMYASELTFADFAPAIDGVSCDASVAGMLQFTYAGACTAAGDLHVGKVTFDVSQTMHFEENATSSPVQLFFLITDGYVHHSLPTGEVTDLSVFCDFVEISVFNHLMYDYSDDQKLTISDVSTILDLLGGKTDTEGFEGSLKKTDPTIVDVANVLDLIAIEKKQTLQNGYTL
ncbi:MAG: peptidoglycan-binding protein, partial [Clostridia bacterium]|nr:peptidoglycan-binding protein [Clostridia bacterium]